MPTNYWGHNLLIRIQSTIMYYALKLSRKTGLLLPKMSIYLNGDDLGELLVYKEIQELLL